MEYIKSAIALWLLSKITDETLADEIFMALAKYRTCSNCIHEDCSEQEIGPDLAPDEWGCSVWKRRDACF